MSSKTKKDETKGFIIIDTHKAISLPVTADNLALVQADANKMFDLCENLLNAERGPRDLYALAHSQVTKKPLRFFVLNYYSDHMKGYMADYPPVIINPVIVDHVKVAVQKPEGCATFLNFPMKNVERYHKIRVKFTTVKDWDADVWELGEEVEMPASSLIAQIFQHEIDHMDGKYIYDFNLLEKK